EDRAQLLHAQASAAVRLGDRERGEARTRDLAPQLGVEPLAAPLQREQPLVAHAVGEDPPRELPDCDELFGGGEIHGVRLWRGRAGQEGSGRNSGSTSSSSTRVNSTRTRMPI